METRAHYVLIGAFTLMVIVAAFALTWYVSGAGGLSSGRFYQVVFRGSVNGLTNGAVVTFNGLRVGEVVNVGYVASDPGAVSSLIKVEGEVPVRADTVAKLESQGLGGASTIALIGGAPDAPDLKSENGNPPKLIGESSSMANLLENVASLSSKAESAVTKADALIGDNSAAVGDAVKNLDQFSKALGDSAPELKQTLAALGELGRRAGPLVDHVDKLAADADHVIAAVDPDHVRSIVSSVDELTKKLNASADKLEAIAGSLSGSDSKGPLAEFATTAKSIRQLADDLDVRIKEISPGLARFSNSGLKEWEAVAVDSRHAIGDLDRILHNLEKNPSALLFGNK
jgi:phospholipid/cholesterol/gamma-HCH transport system substrate-binding protein